MFQTVERYIRPSYTAMTPKLHLPIEHLSMKSLEQCSPIQAEQQVMVKENRGQVSWGGCFEIHLCENNRNSRSSINWGFLQI